MPTSSQATAQTPLLDTQQALERVGDAEALHAPKGIVPIFCHEPLSEQVRNLERVSKTVQPADLPELCATYADLRLELEQLLAEVDAALHGMKDPLD